MASFMKMRYFTIVLLMLSAIHLHAGSISCTTATSLVPDGSVLDFDSIQALTDSWYRFSAAAGRSYSIQVRDDVDADNPDLTVTYYGPGTFPPSSCSSPTPLTLITCPSGCTDTTATEPALAGNAKRVSIVTPSSLSGGSTYWIKVHNGSSTSSHYVSASVTETTLYAPSWSTYSSFNTGWNFVNATSQTITYTFTAVAYVGGTGTYTTTGTIAGTSSSTPYFVASTGALGVPASQDGDALFTHNGPPGAIAKVAYTVNAPTYLVGPALALPANS